MSHRLLIVTGHDRPGIVSAVSGLLARRHINLEDLRMSILEGEFAMMVVVRIPDQGTQVLLDRELNALEKKWRLTIFQCPLGLLAKSKKTSARKSAGRDSEPAFVIRVLGKDKAGIVAGVSRILAKYQCNITDLQCRILGAGAKALYTMILECRAPAKLRLAGLQKALDRLARSLDIEVRLQKADIVHL